MKNDKNEGLFLNQLFDSDDLTRNRALDEILELQLNDSIKTALIKVMKNDPDIEISCKAAFVLFQFDNINSEALDHLILKINDPVEENAACAMGFLEELGESAVNSVPALCDIIKNSTNINLRLEAIETLRNMGKGLVSAIPTFIQALDDDNPEIRRASVGSLRRIKPISKNIIVIPKLISMIQNDNDAEVRRSICLFFKRLGMDSKEIKSALTKCSQSDFDNGVREYANDALKELAGKNFD